MDYKKLSELLYPNITHDINYYFEKYKDMGAPFEWIDAKTENYSGLRYGTSGVLPYIGILKIISDNY